MKTDLHAEPNLIPAVEVRHLTKEFRQAGSKKRFRAVDDVSFRIMPGEIYGLIGPNGSGKSTTMKALLGLIAPSSGECLIFGHNSLHFDTRHQVGFLPENPYFYKHLNGEETLKFYGKLCGMHGKALQVRIDELLELVDLQEARHRRIGVYSKGMLQRIGLAQALIQQPKLLILDEPTAGVDPIGSRQIRDLIFKLKAQGTTILLCSHLLEQVQEVCDRIAIIYQGKVVTEGSLEELISIENQTQITIENLPADLLQKFRTSIDELSAHSDTHWVSHGKPSTTLERLFLSETIGSEERKISG